MAEEEESHPIDPPIEVDIPGYSEKTHFYTWEELHEFVEGERAAWEWLGESDRQRLATPLGAVSQHHLKTLKNLPTWTNPTSSKGPEHHKNNITDALALYPNGDLVCSKSAAGQYILGLARTDPKAALGALAFLASQTWALHDQTWRDVLRGATKLAVSRIDEKGAVARATEALDALRNEWGKRLDEQRTSFEGLQAEVKSQQKASDTEQARVAQVWVEQEEKAEAFFQGAQQEKDDLKDTFIEHMRLKAPADYWRKKAIAHLIWAVGAFISFAAVSAFAARMLIENASFILALVQPANDGGFPWGNVVIITLPALAFFWFLRFIARVFVTNLQRHQGARERATMVQTYLALVKEGEHVATPDERILVLNALFRPGPGDAPDEAPPAELLDIIKRAPKQ